MHPFPFDFDWMQSTLNAFGISGLLATLQSVSEPAGVQIRKALTTSAHILASEPQQLAAQLCGRLIPDGAEISALLGQAQQARSTVWLRPVTPSLLSDCALTRTFQNDRGHVVAVAVMPDGERLLTASSEGTLDLWELTSGALLSRTAADDDGLAAMALTHDGKYAVSGSWASRVKVWEIATGGVVRELGVATGQLGALAITPDGSGLVCASAIGGGPGTVEVWDLNRGVLTRSLEEHNLGVTAIAITPDSSHAVCRSWDQLIILNLRTGSVVQRIAAYATDGLAISPDGKHIVSGCHDGSGYIWSLHSGEVVRKLEGGSRHSVTAVAITPDGKHAVCGCFDNALRIWNVATGELVQSLAGHSDLIGAVAITPSGKWAISGSQDGTSKLWELDCESLASQLPRHPESVTALAITPDSGRAITVCPRTVSISSVDSGCLIRRLDGNAHHTPLAITCDSKRIVSVSLGGRLDVWDLNTGALVRTLVGEADRITAAAITPDSKLLIIGSSHQPPRVWDLDSGVVVRTLEEELMLRGVAFMPSSEHAICVSYGRLLVWGLNSGVLLSIVESEVEPFSSVAVTPDGMHALTGSDDGELKLWQLCEASLVRTFRGHAGGINCLAISENGQRAASAADDKTLILWNLATGTALSKLCTDAPILHCALAFDGRRIVATDRAGHVHFLDVMSPP